MRPAQDIVRLLDAYLEIWQRHFPGQFRRAQWHIVRHLGTAARQGCAAGEISGFVRQIFLLDEATVRERILSLHKLEFCTIEPPVPLTARSFIAPTPHFLRQFDAHLAAFAAELALPATDVAPAIDAYCAAWRGALDQIFTARRLSGARQHEARRQLMSPSHWTLALLATRHCYDPGEEGDGLLADHMAARLLRLAGQNFQTTRDHIATLMEIGLLERRGGKALHVALTAEAARAIHVALGAVAAQWQALAQPPPEERTMKLRPPPGAVANLSLHRLRIVRPEAARRHVPIATIPLTIGRAPPADLVLEGADISRAHCRIEMIGEQICVTDLQSTNGTQVNGTAIAGTVPLLRGAVLTIGGYVLEYEHLRDPDATLTVAATTRRNKPENSW